MAKLPLNNITLNTVQAKNLIIALNDMLEHNPDYTGSEFSIYLDKKGNAESFQWVSVSHEDEGSSYSDSGDL